MHNDRAKASSMYKAWLNKITAKAGMVSLAIKASKGRLDKSQLFHRHTFEVRGKGNLLQVTKLLYDFYSIDHLHRVQRLVIVPMAKSKNVDLTIKGEFISLIKSAPRDTPLDIKANRLDKKDLKDYIDAIVNRNFFSKANIAPQFASSSVPDAIIGRRYSHKIKANDADKDGVKFALEKAPKDFPVKVDESGYVSVRPEKKGEFLVSIRVTDNGLPAKSHVQDFKFYVKDPPPPPKVVKRPDPPKFDTSKLAFLTAIIETGGKQEIWINLRNEDRTLRLHIGDKVNIGLLDGRIVGIAPRLVTIKRNDGKTVTVSLGKNFAEQQEIADAGE